ncbi:MAG: hypothetical protein JXC36_03115 [Candidatus Atribacteria bacterium]|nr:hypothetical protein [Candidatus Atribacteria bacterium]
MPMMIFISYSMGLSLAVTSGSRYIIPIDWILWFYYGLAIIGILRKVAEFLSQNQPMPEIIAEPFPDISSKNNKYFMVLSLCFVVLIAISTPIANIGLKTQYSNTLTYPQILALRDTLPAQLSEKEEIKIMFGQIQYPYYHEDGTLSFDMLVDLSVHSFKLDVSENPLSRDLTGGERVFLVTVEKKSVLSIFSIVGDSTIKIWESDTESF